MLLETQFLDFALHKDF